VQNEDGSWGMNIEYDDVTVNLFEINEDGSIGKMVDVAFHKDTNPFFLLHSHAHSAVWAPSGKFFACNDKGGDNIYFYRIDYEKKKLVLMGEPYKDETDSAPRYCAFHPTKPFFFNNHEGVIKMSAYRYDDDASLAPINTVVCIPDDLELPVITGGFKPGQKPALQGMTISADGKYLYNAINGERCDGVSVLKINQDDGSIELIQYLPAEGKWTRGLALSPDGKFLVLACMDGDGAVISYAVGKDGTLTPTGSSVNLPGASFVTFYTVD
jgi:6-phosphogluconolactonase (cycloisomerase 2 family)